MTFASDLLDRKSRQPRLIHSRARIAPAERMALALAIAIAALVAAPIVSLANVALKGDMEIWQHLARYVLPQAIRDTALLLAGVAAITASVGIATAWVVSTYRFPLRDALAWALALPLAIPTYIVAYVYVDVFEALGPMHRLLQALLGLPPSLNLFQVRSLPGAIFVMGFVLYPYVYLSVRAMFQTQSASLVEVARTLGATRWMLWRHVALPLARPALAVGLALALLETLNDIGASEYLSVRTLTLSIFTTWLNRSSLPGAAQIACMMLVVAAGLIALERYGQRNRRFALPIRRPRVLPPIALAGWRKWAATTICLVPVGLGFLLPAGYLSYQAIHRGLFVGFDPDLFRHTLTTFTFAAAATAIVIVLGLVAVVAVRLTRTPLASFCFAIAGLGYAVPGTVLALGLLSPLVAVDDAINWLTRTFAGTGVGLVFAGSGAAVVTAYVVRFLAIATGSAQAGLARVSTHIDDVARTLGTRPGGIVRYIHMPLSRPALAGAALLVFVDCLKELPATLLLRPLNVETLSTYIYQFATRGNFEDGALAALLIVAVGILPVIRMVSFADVSLTPDGGSSARRSP